MPWARVMLSPAAVELNKVALESNNATKAQQFQFALIITEDIRIYNLKMLS